MEHNLKTIASVAQKIGNNPAYVQGGGGNVSYKVSDNIMSVKASGFCLCDLSSTIGFVDVVYPNIAEFYETSPEGKDIDTLIVENDAVVAKHTLADSSLPQPLRPSIETGFHAILGKSIIHSHSVYVNVLACTEEGKNILHNLFPGSVYVAYNTPGVTLTFAIKEACADNTPSVIFLENHGLITIGHDPDEAYEIHEQVNTIIREKYGLQKTYPAVAISSDSEKLHQSNTPYIQGWIQAHPDKMQAFAQTILFPDQVVYGEKVGFTGTKNNPIYINLQTGNVTYTISSGEALAFEETLAAWVYILNTIETLSLHIKTLSAEEGSFITGLASEKYRKSII